MDIGKFGRLLRKNIKKNSPVLWSVAAGVGTLGTAYLAGKASWQAARMVDNYESIMVSTDRNERYKERVKLVWKLYIPTAFSAVGTVGLIAGANRIGAKKTLAAQTAFAVSQQVFSEYRDKVVEEFGEHKDQSIRDKIAGERIKKNPPGPVIMGSGTVLCCEMFTGRYFNSNMETLQRSVNDLNKRILAHDYATMNDLYYLIDLPQTSHSGQLGWDSDKLLELEFSTQLTEDGRPCITFEYNYTKNL